MYTYKQSDKLATYDNLLSDHLSKHLPVSEAKFNELCLTLAKACGLRVHHKALAEMGKPHD